MRSTTWYTLKRLSYPSCGLPACKRLGAEVIRAIDRREKESMKCLVHSGEVYTDGTQHGNRTRMRPSCFLQRTSSSILWTHSAASINEHDGPCFLPWMNRATSTSSINEVVVSVSSGLSSCEKPKGKLSFSFPTVSASLLATLCLIKASARAIMHLYGMKLNEDALKYIEDASHLQSWQNEHRISSSRETACEIMEITINNKLGYNMCLAERSAP